MFDPYNIVLRCQNTYGTKCKYSRQDLKWLGLVKAVLRDCGIFRIHVYLVIVNNKSQGSVRPHNLVRIRDVRISYRDCVTLFDFYQSA